MSKAATAAKSSPPSPAQLVELRVWASRGEGCVSLSLSLPPPQGDTAAEQAQRAYADFEQAWKEQARQLPEHAAALAARQDLDAAQHRLQELRQELTACSEQTLDARNGSLERQAEREASLQRQADLIGRRLPKLVEAAAKARMAFSIAATGLRTRLRSECLTEARRDRDRLAAELAAGGRLDALLALGLAADAYALSGMHDSSAAESFTACEMPALEQPGPRPAAELPDALKPPWFAHRPAEWPRQPATSTPAPPVQPPQGWAAVSPEQAEQLRADQEKQRLVAEHAAQQRARQQAEAAAAAAQEDLAP
jgi:hypothetical protein